MEEFQVDLLDQQKARSIGGTATQSFGSKADSSKAAISTGMFLSAQ